MRLDLMNQSTEDTLWVYVASCSDFEIDNARVIRVEGKQIAIFKINQEYRACDNRCPHEGFPLSQGSISESSMSDGENKTAKDCILTCNWHNWKFDLSNGDNLYGGDQLRTYPLEIRGQEIWLDITEQPYAERRATIEKSLHESFDDHAYDRIAREIARLIQLGDDPLDALRLAIEWSWQRLEFGWTHAYAGIADWLELYDETNHDPELQLVCLLESVGHIAYDVLREGEYPYTRSASKYDEDLFLNAIESEDEIAAVSMVRGGLKDGLTFDDFEAALSQAALAHYNDFGHSIIYVTKAGSLIKRLGAEVAEAILTSLVRNLIFASREDKIPEFKGYATTLDDWKKASDNKQSSSESTEFNLDQWRRFGINKALQATLKNCHKAPEQLYSQWLLVNAVNLLSYDIEQQNKVAISISGNVGWLNLTHGITFANAVRKQCTKFPKLWPQALLQLACFSGRHVAFTEDNYDLEKWSEVDFETLLAKVFDHGQDEYIVSVHWLKLTLAVREEAARLPEHQAQYLMAALNRFMHSPMKRKHTKRVAYQSRLFVSKQS